MAHTFVDIINNLLKYDDQEIIILFDDSLNLWFSGNQVAKILEYKRPDKAIKDLIDEKYKILLSELIADPKEIHLNAQPNSIYISEYGLYDFLLNSKQPKAKKFHTWLVEEVLPEIRTNGKYKIAEKYKKDIDKANNKIKTMKNIIKKFENNKKKNKYPNGGVVYVLRPIGGDKNLLKIGKTKNLNPRLNTYNTSVPDNMELLHTLPVENPTAVEYCIKGMLDDYRYRDNKEYYECSLKKVIDVFNKCDKIIKKEFYCDKCDKKINGDKLSRHVADENNIDEDEIGVFGLVFSLPDQTGGNLVLDDNFFNEYKALKYEIKFKQLSLDVMK
jgi:prophage antirepressor-like protein